MWNSLNSCVTCLKPSEYLFSKYYSHSIYVLYTSSTTGSGTSVTISSGTALVECTIPLLLYIHKRVNHAEERVNFKERSWIWKYVWVEKWQSEAICSYLKHWILMEIIKKIYEDKVWLSCEVFIVLVEIGLDIDYCRYLNKN